ncbi:MAG: matrixin family metalloprotease [Proteobacteria bacterium]|nr:matrixin family metalloprotease [Pseudomonadota bacterium]
MDWRWHPALTFAIAILFSLQASAYPTPVDFGGKLLRWNINEENPTLSIAIKADNLSRLTNLTSMTLEAANTWSQVPKSYVRLRIAGSNEDADITINFTESIAGGETAAGYAEFDQMDENDPVHCSIHIADSYALDWEGLAKTTLHELGHCLGLGHSLVGESIMSYKLDENSFALAVDDEAAIARLYPVGSSHSKLPLGCTMGGVFPFENSILFLALTFLMPLLLIPLKSITRP